MTGEVVSVGQSVDQVPSEPVDSDNPHHAKRWWILGVLGLAQLMVILDATIVNIALPSAQSDLGFSDSQRAWIITAYALAFGTLLLLGGRLADLFGRKRMFLIGLTGFALSSALGGAATGFGTLVTARALQGAFGALLAPAALALLTTTFMHAKARAKAFGIYGTIGGIGGAIGLLLGGILTEYLSWRWCFYVNLIFAGVALVGGALLLHHRRADHRPQLDIPGVLTVSAGLFCLVYGFSHASTAGWADAVTIGFLVAGTLLLVAFVVIQSRVAHPLLPLRVLADRNRGGALIAMFMTSAGMFGVMLFLTYYLQLTLGFSSFQTGTAFLPMVGSIMLSAAIGSSVLATRVSPRIVISLGSFIAGVGIALLTRITVDSSYVTHVLPGLILVGFGLGLVFSLAMATATLGVHAEDSGVAAATVNTAQQIGGSIGTALLSTIAATALSGFLVGKDASPSVLNEAAVQSYVAAFWWSAAIFALGGIICAAVLRSGIPAADPQPQPAVHA